MFLRNFPTKCGRSGLGPTTLDLAFQNIQELRKLVQACLRKNAPIAVRRGSPSPVQTVSPSCVEVTRMVLNLYIVKTLPFLPTRCCLKSMGPREVIRIARAIASIGIAKTINTALEKTMSKMRLKR